MRTRFGLAWLSLLILINSSQAQTTAFTYQGKLVDNGTPATGNYDFQFSLFDAVSGGTQQGTTQTVTNQLVTNGIFSVQLDFVNCAGCSCPTCFNGAPRFLAIAVRPAGGGAFTPLTPRQPLTSTPYAVKSMNAANATTADGLSVACINCVTSSQIASVNGSAVTGTIPVASVPSGSANYIQNTTSPQAASNFNISGDGTVGGTLSAGVVNAVSQYNIVSPALGSSIRLLGISGTGDTNTFLGRNAAAANPTGSFNSFFGNGAGQSTVDGGNNSFFGSGAGSRNISGTDNTFFGRNAGFANDASENSFFGSFAGAANTSGTQNSFFGTDAGRSNSNGNGNSFFGGEAGSGNTTGFQNSFFGNRAGTSNSTGNFNSFFGGYAGHINSTGAENSFFGNAAGMSNFTGNFNTFIGASAGSDNTTGASNAFFGRRAGLKNSAGGDNAFFGANADFNALNFNGNNNTMLGSTSMVTAELSNQTAIGALALVTQSNSLVLGAINGVNGASADTNVGIGTTAPATRLHISGGGAVRARINSNGNAGLALTLNDQPGWSVATVTGGQFQIFNDALAQNAVWIDAASNNVGINTSMPADRLHVAGDIRVGTGTTGCVKDADGTIIAGTCSSDARLKRDIVPFTNLLDKLVRLQPVHFYWAEEFKERHFGARQSFGLIAQEVEQVMPELVTEDEQGYKAVNYSKLPLLTLQAIKELKAENDTLKTKLSEQQMQITQLRQEMNESNNSNAVWIDSDSNNVGIGTAPSFKLHLVDPSNTGLRVQNNTPGGTVASFGGNGSFQVDSGSNPGGRFYNTEDGKVGINLDFNGSPDRLAVNGTVSLFLASGGLTQICMNGGNQLSTCSSSLRYKTNIATWPTGLSLISRLRPVTFDWKKGGDHDLGLIAEEVAKVEPLLVTHNDKGEIEGVKYDRLAVVLLNAVKEQQHLIEQQQHQIEALKNLVCSSHREAQVCK